MDAGTMDRDVVGGLINSISRFNLVVASQNVKSAVLKDFSNIVSTLKLLKPVLDEAVALPISSDKELTRASEKLDTVINEAREILEKQPQRISKIYNVLQNEPIVLKVQKFSSEICDRLNKLLQSSSLCCQSASIQHCMQEIHLPQQVLTSQLIDNALKDQRNNVKPEFEDVMKIVESLGITSSQKLLLESIALEKERIKAELKRKTEDAECIEQIISLVNHICYCMAPLDQFGFINGIPVPSYFRCPLSLGLMMDPVILASGQTYERSYIQNWLDNGLRVCPKTRQPLAHINLVPNDTVKSLIANWCAENKVRLCDSAQSKGNPSSFGAGISLDQDSSLPVCPNKVSASRFSSEYENEIQLEKAEISPTCNDEQSCFSNHHQVSYDDTLPSVATSERRQSDCHSLTESIASTISSVEMPSKFEEKLRLLGDSTYYPYSPSNKDIAFLPWFSPGKLPGTMNGSPNKCARSFSSSMTSEWDDLTTASHVEKLVDDLQSEVSEVQVSAASELRLLTKHNMENRTLVGSSGAIPPLISLLYSKVKRVQETAVTALLNLSINNHNKVLIAEAGGIEPLIYVLEYGSPEAQENSAAALFSLSVMEDYRVKIGRSGAIKGLANLLASGTLRGKKDAATALFNLSIFHENKVRIVQAGGVEHLIELLEPSMDMVDKSLALLANLSTIPEGRLAIVQKGGIPLLVEMVETGSPRGKENAASALLQLCINSHKICSLVLQEGAVPPLLALSQFGTPRAKDKAQQILSHFRSQRDGGVGRAKS